jgi:hypothetical protein
MASVLNSLPITGSAILIEESINGVIKELSDAIKRAVNLAALSFNQCLSCKKYRFLKYAYIPQKR